MAFELRLTTPPGNMPTDLMTVSSVFTGALRGNSKFTVGNEIHSHLAYLRPWEQDPDTRTPKTLGTPR